MYSFEEAGGDLEKIFSDDSYTAWMKRKHKAVAISDETSCCWAEYVLYLIVMWALVYPFSWTAYL
jgi:hypothetical protein